MGLGIAYVPDFIVNAGVMIRARMSTFPKPDKKLALKNIDRLFETICDILPESREQNLLNETVAERIAVERINRASQRRETMEE